ncbi:hypothetical protein GCM10027567_32180 [Spongiibacter taiwanensis]
MVLEKVRHSRPADRVDANQGVRLRFCDSGLLDPMAIQLLSEYMHDSYQCRIGQQTAHQS